jgi:hypothetical protein
MNSQLQALLNQRIQAFAADITTLLQGAVADAVASALGGAPIVVKRGPGRPPKNPGAPKANPPKASAPKPAAPKPAAPKSGAPKRGPGRPPKAAFPAAPAPMPAPAKKFRGRRKGEKRTNAELDRLTEALFREITREGGRRIEQIGLRMGVPTKDLALPVKKLLDNKRIKTKGQRRATSYTAA